MPFAFVPRSVSKYTKEWQGISRPSLSPSPPPDPATDGELDDDNDDTRKGKEKAVEPARFKQLALTQTQDIASLISLSLSDYNIWLDPDLRWKLEACLQDDVSPNDAGYVPINYLVRRVPFLGSLALVNGDSGPSETEVVKALRAHAGRTFEVRMRLPTASSISSSVWYGAGKTSRKKDVGGYEVRRRDWATLRHRVSRGWTRAQWDDMTAYMECIPPPYRTVGSIARFAESLLSETNADTESGLRVQCIILPHHHLDKPGDMPKCKGYALITFSTKADFEAVLSAWPWRRIIASNNKQTASSIEKTVRNHGLRATSKARWEALNDEYLLYKQSLIEELAHAETEMHRSDQGAPDDAEPLPLPRPKPRSGGQTTPPSPYPFDCLVFVRNIHMGTNKTTLKSLFSQAFHDQDGTGLGATTALDYVDFTKGMDTCYLRLASPAYATRLLALFDTRLIAQAHGLDARGRTPLEEDKAIVVEMVRGKKEEVYWEKVPEKVRRQAVNRVIQAQQVGAELSSATATASAVSARHKGANESKRRKRRRDTE